LTQTIAPPTLNLGFLTVLRDTSGYLGGYLVTNQWGRPLEFRLSTAVQPNRVQQILYAGTMEPYLCADLIGKTLLDKTAVPVQLLLTDTQAVLDLRLRVEMPVLWLAPAGESESPTAHDQPGVSASAIAPVPSNRAMIHCHTRFPEDAAAIREILDRLTGVVDLAEPFARIREAIGEARKMGVTGRASGAA
jgi:hypothetical protein